jgi:hypothetical protein
MLTTLTESSGNALGLRISGDVTAMDYEAMTREVQALVDRHGEVNLLLDLGDFKLEGRDAWKADLAFGQAYRKKISRLAIVGDKTWQQFVAKVAEPFFARESKFFTTNDRDAAWAWLRSASTSPHT